MSGTAWMHAPAAHERPLPDPLAQRIAVVPRHPGIHARGGHRTVHESHVCFIARAAGSVPRRSPDSGRRR